MANQLGALIFQHHKCGVNSHMDKEEVEEEEADAEGGGGRGLWAKATV